MKKTVIILSLIMCFNNVVRAQFPTFKYSGKNKSNHRVGMVYKYGMYCKNEKETSQDEINSVPYNHWFQSGPHNTYEHNEPSLNLTSLYDYLLNVSSLIELDIHSSTNSDWRVYHKYSNEQVNCGGYLSKALDEVKMFHNNHPEHHVITVWMELKGKDIWDNANPETLNDIFKEHLGESFIYSPENFLLKNNSDNLREAANKGWPTLGELRGKIIIVLFNHNSSKIAWPTNKILIKYNKEATYKKAFIAGRMYGKNNGSGNVDKPEYFDDKNKNDIVFYSLKGDSYADHCYGLEIFRTNRVSSTFYVNSTSGTTPGVSEYRDFLIQHARWGKERNTESHNQAYQYSGYLKKTIDSKSMVKLKSGTKFLDIKDNELKLEDIKEEDAPYFAVVDVWIDYDNKGQFPSESNEENRAFLIQPLINMDTTNPNEKIVEAKGYPNNKDEEDQKVILYGREKTEEKIRPKDQYWEFIKQKDGTYIIQNKFYESYIHASKNSLVLKKKKANAVRWEIK